MKLLRWPIKGQPDDGSDSDSREVTDITALEIHERVRETIAALIANAGDPDWSDRILSPDDRLTQVDQYNFLMAALGSALGQTTNFVMAIAAAVGDDPLKIWADWCAHVAPLVDAENDGEGDPGEPAP